MAAMRAANKPIRKQGRWSMAALAFFALLGVLALSGRLPSWLAALYLLLSVITFFSYRADKSAARNSAWRTSESRLLLLGLLGGWPGALLAQRLLRHKSSKPAFQAAFQVTVVLNCAALAWLLWPWADGLRSLLTI